MVADPAQDSVNPAAGRRGVVVDPAADAAAVIDGRERAARAATARRRAIVLASLGGGVVAIAALWYFVLRDRTSACAAWLGDPATISAYANGAPVRPGFSHDGSYGCHESYVVGARIGDGVSLATEADGGRVIQARRKDEERRAYAEHVTIALPGQGGDGYLFLAGDRPEPGVAAMQADAMQRVGHTADPMGDMLQSLPPSQHVALFLVGDELATLRLDRTAFTADGARSLVLDVARRARR